MKKSFIELSVFALLLGFIPSSIYAEDVNQLLPLPSSQAIYVLSENLAGSEAALFIESKETRKGIWEEDHFSFYGIGKEGDIQVVSESADGQNWQSIQMNTLRATNRTLQFLSVPTGSGMNFYFKTALDKPSKQNVYIYVLIKAGKIEIVRFRVTCNQEGWQKQWIPLGVLRLFARTFPLTIVVLGDKVHSPSFQFYSEVYP